MIQPIQVTRCVSDNGGCKGGIPPLPPPPHMPGSISYMGICVTLR